MKSKHPEQDVWLSDGQMFMTGQGKYQDHLASSTEIKQVGDPYSGVKNII